MSTKKKVPLRQCVGCSEMKPKKEMVRIIKTPEGEILMDTTGKKNGRGAYICKSSACLAQTRKNRGLERSLKSSIAPEIYELLQKEMEAFEE